MFETQKSGNKTSSEEIGLNIRTLVSPEVGQDQVSGGVIIMPHPLQIFNENLSRFGKRSNSVISSRSVIESTICVMPEQWRVSL